MSFKTSWFLIAMSFLMLFVFNFESFVYANGAPRFQSYKLRVILKNGNEMLGYVLWNRDCFSDFLQSSEEDYVKDYVGAISATAWGKVDDEQLFKCWLEIISLKLKSESPFKLEGCFYKKDFELYKKIEKYSGHGYGVAKSNLLKINLSDVSAFLFVPQDTHVNTTGRLAVFSDADIKLLDESKPFFFAEVDTGVSTWEVSCYNRKDTFEKFLDNLLCICPADSFTYKNVRYLSDETEEDWRREFEKSNLTKLEREDILEYLRKNKKLQNCSDSSFSLEKLKKRKYVISSESYD